MFSLLWNLKCSFVIRSKIQQKKAKNDKKKRIGRAVNSILLNEKNTHDCLFSDSPSKTVWLYHFGCGDQDDQDAMELFLQDKGEHKLIILPGIGYGLILFEEEESAKKLFEEGETKAFLPVKFGEKDRNVVFLYSKLNSKEEIKYSQYKPFPSVSTSIDLSGIDYFTEIISQEEEKGIVDALNKSDWSQMSMRKVLHYGYEFVYGRNNIDKNKKIGELPSFLSSILDKTAEILKLFKLKDSEKKQEFVYDPENKLETPSFFELYGNFDQLTVNDYQPGCGIPPHFDSHSPFEDVFCSVSLCSGITMQFDSPEGESSGLYLLPRSAVFFSGEPRFTYDHSIPTRKLDKVDDRLITRRRRISLTFRKVRPGECECDYPKYCDSRQNQETDVEINETADKPTEVEKVHVYDVYNKIAPHFSHTRYKPWPRVKEFLDDLPKHSIIADVGCGNGKYMWVRENDCFHVGTDRSENLLKIVREKVKNSQVFAADSLKLPLRDNSVDAAISIAVIHHFSNVTMRVRAVKEIARVLRTDGKALLYVWAKDQEGRTFSKQDNYVEWNLHKKYETDTKLGTLGPVNRKEEHKQATVYHRFYHVFIKGELENLVDQVDSLEILDSYYHKDNWAVVVRKK